MKWKSPIICAAYLCWTTIVAKAISDADNRIESKRIEATEIQLWHENLVKAPLLPVPERIDLLGFGLRNMAYRKKWPASDPEISVIYDSLQNELLSIPGHAEHYRDKINGARMKMEAVSADPVKFAYESSRLRNVILIDFPKFENMPSIETVRVLGVFLFDERGFVRIDKEIKTESEFFKIIEQGPVFGRAAESLLKLPIEQKPVPETRYPNYTNPEDVKPWRDWIEEIRSGKRTFRFIGDPTEYDLDGPASREKVARIAKIRERDAERLAGRKRPARNTESDAATNPSPKESMALIVATIGALLGGIWYFLVRRRSSSASR